jgi:preprotein translocase subunit SecA
LQEYRRLGSYRLMPAFGTEEESEAELIQDEYLAKRELHVREAWEIGRHDPDSVAIQEDDTPIIPAGQGNAPAIELLRWKHERSPTQPSTSIDRSPKQKIGRNDPCPCGSGKKYKKCHGT